MLKRFSVVLAVLLLGLLILSACAPVTSPAAEEAAPAPAGEMTSEEEAVKLSGDILVENVKVLLRTIKLFLYDH